MSKAFTRESDDAPERPNPPRRAAALPPGVKNYLTPGGEKRLREELGRLMKNERPAPALAADDPDARRQLAALDQRIEHLQQSLQTAVVVPPPPSHETRARFGATVTVRHPQGEESSYRLVGMDETDLERNWISWLSPIARTLLNTEAGQRVRFKFPSGEEELEIVRIEYGEDSPRAE